MVSLSGAAGWNAAHQLFERQVERSPAAVAVVCGARQLTYAELNARANQVAHFLRKSGVGPESLVGVCLERTPELVAGLLGVWKAGAAYVPLDPAYPSDRLAFMVGDASIRMLLTERKCRGLFAPEGLTAVCLDDGWPTLAKEPDTNLDLPAEPSSLAYVMYTSGSTGRPKGAMILHGGLTNYLTWAIGEYGVVAGGSVPVHSSIAFDLTVTSLYPALLAGGQVELLAEEAGAQHLLAALRRRKGRNLVKITPAHLDLIAQQLRPEELAGLAEVFVIGGENLPAESLSVWRDFAPSTRLINEYGPTETVVGCCVYEVQSHDPRNGPVPIGRAIAHTELYILDENRQRVAPGTMGELYIGGAGVARGYFNRPELTAERFLADPFTGRAGARLYKTGDLARERPDGILEFLGRVDNQVKIRGYRIELGEIEAVLASEPRVQACAVLAREDTPGNRQLVGYVVPKHGPRPPVEELQSFLIERLPEYMAPAQYVFLDAFPLTVNGKVDRKALPAPADASAPEANKFGELRTETEKAVAALWSELLKVDNLGPEADFFDLGGHSLLAIKALARIRDQLGVDLSPQTMFEHSKLGEVAARVDEAKGVAPEAHRIARRKRTGPSVVSPAQQQFWLLDQLVPGSPAYNIVDVVPLHGKYQAQALKRALKELVARHETLRTSFSEVGGQLMQTVAAPFEPQLDELDLSAGSDDERQRGWTQRVREQGRRPFDLARVPLFRASLVHFSPTEHRLLVVIHHIIGDEWSMELIHKELGELYAAFSRGQPSPLKPLPIQYADFALWQRERLQGERVKGQLAYWKNELKDALPMLALPPDRPRPATPSLRGSTEAFQVSKELLERLQAIGKQEQATLFMVLEAAFAALLRRQTGQDDILVGTPISGRHDSDTQQLIGCFLNTLVLRAQFQSDTSFRALVQQTRVRALGAYANADVPFEQLVAELSPERDPARTPLFQVMFVLHSKDRVSQVSKLSGRRELEPETSKFELTLFASETASGLEGWVEYSTDLFEAETIQRLCASYVQLLELAAREPGQPLAKLPIPEAELARLKQFNQTVRDYPRDSSVAQLFEQQVAKTPDSVAVRCGAASSTYRELEARANQLARALRRRGVQRGSIVGLSLTRSVDMVAAMLGVLKAGGAYLPLDPAFPAARLAFMVEDSKLALVVSESEHAGQHGAPKDKTLELDRAGEELAKESKEPLGPDDRSARPDDPAYVLYTSGSTGKPKGVLVHERAAVNVLTSMAREPGCGPKDRWLAVTTLSFDIALLELLLPLMVGGEVVLASRDEAMDAEALARLIEAHDITLMQATPVTWRMLVDSGWKGRAGLKVISGGEPLAVELAEALVSRVAEVWNNYGPTETTVYSTAGRVTQPRLGVSIGRPVANTSVWVLDAGLKPCPIGVQGELYIGGDGVALGYLHRPELTKERFIEDPFGWAPGARLYRTGDLGRIRADGQIDCLGRTDSQVKVRGFRIELGEVEARLADHAGLRESCVVVRKPPTGEPALAAYYVPAAGQQVAAADLRGHLRAALPDYMVPQRFVELKALPRTQNGKIDRKALPDPFVAAAPLEAAVLPRSETERSVAAVWEELLGTRGIGVHDNFFELGGHSLLAVKALGRLRDQLAVNLSSQTLFKHSTVEALAAHIDQLKGAGGEVHRIPRRSGTGPSVTSFTQQQFWLLDQLLPGNHAYTIVDVVPLEGKYQAHALKSALKELISRHESLRTFFSQENGQLRQTVVPPFEPQLDELDLSRAPEEERQRAWARVVREQNALSFDLSRTPLFRLTVVHANDTEHRLLLAIHHIIADEWSMELIQKELHELYAAFCAGRPSPLKPLAIQYGDYAAWQRERLKPEVLQAQLGYWKGELQGALTTLALPPDKPRPATPSLRGATEAFQLPKSLLEKLQALGREEQATLFMVMEAAFAALLRRQTGQDDLLVGTPFSGRSDSDTQQLIGCFLNTLVLRSQFEEGTSFRVLLRQVRQRALEAYAHADVPFEQLVAEVPHERDPGRSALFQVMFVLHSAGQVSQVPKLSWGGDLVAETSKFELTLFVAELPNGLEARLEYSTDLFEADTIRRLCRAYGELLEAVTREPERALSALPIPADELARLKQFNQTVREYPKDSSIAQLFEQQVAKSPGAVAVRMAGASITYGELEARANQLARALRRRGIQRGSIVGLSLTRSIEMVAAMLAVLKAGGAYLPLDPAFPAARLAFMVEDSQLALVVSESEHASQHGAPPEKTFELDRAAGELAKESKQALGRDDLSARPEDPAYVLYTSGSTGKPKGVLVHERAAVNVLMSMAREPGLGPKDRWLAVTTLSFDIALLELLLPLMVGGEVVLASRDDAMEAEALAGLLEQHDITVMQATPVTWRMLVDSGWAGRKGLKVISGGEPLAAELAEALVSRVGEVWNNYGPTETTVYSTAGRITEPREGITIGRPISNTSVWVLDARLQPCPIGVQGELYIGGDGVALGYLNRPELTQERFVADPFGWAPGARLYRTGDLGRIRADGRIDCLGRTDSQVKVRGFRIELGEIEARLAENSALREVCVVVKKPAGGEPALVAYYSLAPGETMTTTDLRMHLRGTLPDYMVPQRFIELDALPRTQNGKIDRRSLPDPFAHDERRDEVVPPRTEAEKRVASVWEELLGRKGIGAQDNFFDLGGHSLLVIQCIGQLEASTGVRLNPRSFVVETLAQLAAQLEKPEAKARPSAPAAEDGGLLGKLKGRLLK